MAARACEAPIAEAAHNGELHTRLAACLAGYGTYPEQFNHSIMGYTDE